jgi:hypothetical protein
MLQNPYTYNLDKADLFTSHTHNKKSLDTSVSVSVGTKHTFATSVFLKDKSRKLTSISGGASFSWNDKDLSLSNVFIQFKIRFIAKTVQCFKIHIHII